MRSAVRSGPAIAAIVLLVSAAAFAVDPPDVQINPVSGLIEAVDATWSGSNFNVRYTRVSETMYRSESSLLTTHAADDVDPRVAIAPVGDVLVAWWRDTAIDAVLYRKRSFATGAWNVERPVGLPTESASHPRIIFAGDRAWVAYQIQNAKSRGIGVQIIDDDPEPIRAIVGTTSYGGDLDIRLHAEAGHLWVTWIDGGSVVAYSEYLNEKQGWTRRCLESFASDSIATTLERIRGHILGL